MRLARKVAMLELACFTRRPAFLVALTRRAMQVSNDILEGLRNISPNPDIAKGAARSTLADAPVWPDQRPRSAGANAPASKDGVTLQLSPVAPDLEDKDPLPGLLTPADDSEAQTDPASRIGTQLVRTAAELADEQAQQRIARHLNELRLRLLAMLGPEGARRGTEFNRLPRGPGVFLLQSAANNVIQVEARPDVRGYAAELLALLRLGRHPDRALQAEFVRSGERAFRIFVVSDAASPLEVSRTKSDVLTVLQQIGVTVVGAAEHERYAALGAFAAQASREPLPVPDAGEDATRDRVMAVTGERAASARMSSMTLPVPAFMPIQPPGASSPRTDTDLLRWTWAAAGLGIVAMVIILILRA